MTATVLISTIRPDGTTHAQQIVVYEIAQKHVLRSFNPTLGSDNPTGLRVDATKVLCAALIQQMLDLVESNEALFEKGAAVPRSDLELANVRIRAAHDAIHMIELAQMQAVKANFAEA